MNLAENVKEGLIRGIASGLVMASLAGAGSYIGAYLRMEQMSMSIEQNKQNIALERAERKALAAQFESWKEKMIERDRESAEWRGEVKAYLEYIKARISRQR